MPSALVAAVPASQRNCAYCSNPLGGELAPHVCSRCGNPQPVAADEDYFAAFGVSRQFNQDRGAVEKRFYALSRALHPDRFSTASADVRQASLERMSFLNEAYNTLKNPEALRSYLIQLEGVTPTKQQAPMELVEDWFEIQDVLMDDPDLGATRLKEFQEKLQQFKQERQESISRLEAQYDRESKKELLVAIEREIQTQSYLKSMERDVGRIRR